MKKLLFLLLIILSSVLIVGIINKLNNKPIESVTTNQPSGSVEPANNVEDNLTTKPEQTLTVVDEPSDTPVVEETSLTINEQLSDPNSILVLVNKTHPLPEDYVPSDLVTPNVKVNKNGISLRQEASQAIEEMFKAASDEGITLVLGSSYRSYSYQTTLYNNYVAKDGEEKANKYSAKPGTSEHQTGLAVDISDAAGNYYLKQSFKDTEEGKWLKDNSYKFGFILRFPEGKEDITGYMFEPWHFRYLGVDEATKIYNSGLTMEEYYNILD